MDKREVKNFFNDKKQDLTIEYLYARNKHKGISKGFISFLVAQNQTEAIKLLNKSRSIDDFSKLIKENYEMLVFRFGFIFSAYVLGSVCGLYEGGLTIIPLKVAKNILVSDVKKDDLRNILDLYSDVLIKYINAHNEIKHRLVSSNNVNGFMVTDYTEKFDDKIFKKVSGLLFQDVVGSDYYRQEEMFKLVSSLLAVYNKDMLLNRCDLVKFEIEYGYFDEYYGMLESKLDIPSLEERVRKFELQRDISAEQLYRLNNLDLLEKRISSLNYASKVIFLDKIRQIRQESDIRKQAVLVDACFDYYEKEYRKEIVERAFCPDRSVEVGDFKELEPAMLHLFFRDPMKMLGPYQEKVKKEILNRRGVMVTGEEQLTSEEMLEYQKLIDYAVNVLLNPVVTSKSLNETTTYSDASGIRWYKSDTKNQISIGVFGPHELLRLPNCVGVGFDKTSVDASNIIISSNVYQTTNMGVDNLEVLPENRFRSCSASLTELCDSSKTEVVMYREKDGVTTDASYVFAVVNGLDEKRDRATILQAKEYAEKNQIKMVVFNTKKLRQSYEAMFENLQTEAEIKKEVYKQEI